MRPILFFILALSSLFVACDKVDNNVLLDDSMCDTFDEFVASSDAPIDDDLLLNSLVNGGLESSVYQKSQGDSEQVESFVRFVFNEDGTCLALTKSKVVYSYFLYGDLPVGTPLYSREYSWTYNKERDMLTTIDNYGNSHSAKILYFDGVTLCYEGSICSEMMTADGSVCRMAILKSDAEKWMDGAHPYDSVVLKYVDPNDKRYQRIEELCAKQGDIDDDAFVEALLTRSFSFLYDRDNPDSGVGYGDPGIYYLDADGVVYYKGVEAQNYFWAHALVMFEDGTLRECFSQWLFPEKGELCYNVYNWSYDAETNTLNTPAFESQAEVLYFDGDIAILKGSIMGIPNVFAEQFTDAIFYVRFDRFDRDTLINDYKPYY